MREGRGRRGFFKGRRAQPDCARVQRGPDSGGPSSPCPNPCAASLTPARPPFRTHERSPGHLWLAAAPQRPRRPPPLPLLRLRQLFGARPLHAAVRAGERERERMMAASGASGWVQGEESEGARRRQRQNPRPRQAPAPWTTNKQIEIETKRPTRRRRHIRACSTGPRRCSRASTPRPSSSARRSPARAPPWTATRRASGGATRTCSRTSPRPTPRGCGC